MNRSWFIYDLACAWEGGVGRVMFRPLAERQAFEGIPYMGFFDSLYSPETPFALTSHR